MKFLASGSQSLGSRHGKDIKKGEELSYDYGFNYDDDYKDYPCKCGAKNCVGYIVRQGSRWRIKKKRK